METHAICDPKTGMTRKYFGISLREAFECFTKEFLVINLNGGRHPLDPAFDPAFDPDLRADSRVTYVGN
jgi:hypothetical protein